MMLPTSNLTRRVLHSHVGMAVPLLRPSNCSDTIISTRQFYCQPTSSPCHEYINNKKSFGTTTVSSLSHNNSNNDDARMIPPTPPRVVVRTGSCACGQVRYELHDEPMIVHCCHCTDCKRLTGGAFVINAWTEQDNFKITKGSVQVAELSGGSGRPHTVHFCPNCSTALYSRYRPPLCVYVRVGTLDDAHRPSLMDHPDVHIWTQSKPPWLDLSNVTVPVYEQYYDNMADVWKPSSLDRFAKLMEKAKRMRDEQRANATSS